MNSSAAASSMKNFSPAIEHPSIRYDGSGPVFIDAEFRQYYKLAPLVEVVSPVPSKTDVELYDEYVDSMRRRMVQASREVDAITIANNEARYNEENDMIFADANLVSAWLKTFEDNPDAHFSLRMQESDDETLEVMQDEDGELPDADYGPVYLGGEPACSIPENPPVLHRQNATSV